MNWTSKQALDFFEICTPNQGLYKEEDMGVELEIEYLHILETQTIATYLRKLGWRTTEDNSLRGVSAEHISPPQSVEKTYTDMLAFEKFIEVQYRATIIKPSHRCSTHVHLNFDEAGIVDILKFTALYYVFEPLLAYLSGPDRVANCFCVSTRAVPLTISENILSKKVFYKGIDQAEHAKYSSLNFCRLHDLGTIEVRLMRGYEKAIKLKNWLTVLRDLKRSAKNRFKSLQDIEQKYLDLPYKDFITYVFPEADAAIFAAGVPNLQRLLAEGYRMAFPLLQTNQMLEKGVEAVKNADKEIEKEKAKRLKALEMLRAAQKPPNQIWWDEAGVIDERIWR